MFRKKAESIINGKYQRSDINYSNMEIKELLHELQVFQIELEMQNDELKLSHDYLEIERTKFSGLYDLAPIGYFILDNFGVIEDVNQTGLNMLETPKTDILGKRFQDYVVRGENDVFYSFIRKMRNFNTKHDCQLKISSDTGKIYYVQLEGNGILNKVTGEIQFYIAVIDITKRRQAEQHLQESNERLKMILEATATGTWEIDLKNKHIFLDENSYAIYGFKPWEFDGKYKTFFQLIHPADRENFRSTLINSVKERRDLDTEFRVILEHNGLRHIAVRGHIIDQHTNITRLAGIIIDVTEKKKLQEEADILRSDHNKSIMYAALQAQEKERKRISETLHDSVAQLLYGIRLNLQNYNRTNPLTAQFNNINSLLDQAINETRNISFELAPSILKDFGLIESVNEMARRLTTDNFSIDVKTHGLKVRLNPDLEISCFRIIQELINNCIKHSNACKACIKINIMKELIILTVSDNGTGFNIKNSDYLTQGSGLLSIKNRISLFNGNLEIKEAKDKGIVVEVTLRTEN
ncbi:MAG: putative signal transduction histidine kinase [Mucilaginibacter sp.]|nr:putative signal transduction histidine kinase [Mucilaginibacter sp.]